MTEKYILSLPAKTLQRLGLAVASTATAVAADKSSVALSLENLVRYGFNVNSVAAFQVGRGFERIATGGSRELAPGMVATRPSR
eukprot:5291931-Pyramimonas_sp.AAC.1